MAIFTSSEIEEQITAYKSALLALATAQEYWIGNRKLRRADLPEIRSTLEFLNNEKNKISGNKSGRLVSGIPLR